DVLRYQPRGVDQNPLVIAFAALLRAREQFVDLGIQLLAREQPRLDGALELALQHVEVPAVDDDLINLRPAGRIELASRQRDEGRAGLEPSFAADNLTRGGATDDDIGAAHDVFDRLLGHDRYPER